MSNWTLLQTSPSTLTDCHSGVPKTALAARTLRFSCLKSAPVTRSSHRSRSLSSFARAPSPSGARFRCVVVLLLLLYGVVVVVVVAVVVCS